MCMSSNAHVLLSIGTVTGLRHIAIGNLASYVHIDIMILMFVVMAICMGLPSLHHHAIAFYIHIELGKITATTLLTICSSTTMPPLDHACRKHLVSWSTLVIAV